MSERKRVIMFGAGSAGETFLENIRAGKFNIEVIAVADNNKAKQGSKFHGLNVIEPDKIKELQYDAIVITSIFVNQIRDQLVNELNVDEKKIEIPSKELVKTSKMSRPFKDPLTRTMAREALFFILEILENNKITYFVNHGTLLGIVRDADIIPWDDDIDVSVYADDMEKVLEHLKNAFHSIGYKNGELHYAGSAVYQNRETLIAISVNCKRVVNGQVLHEFSIDVQPVAFENEMAMMPNTYAPAYHFLKTDRIEFKGRPITVPHDHEKYLEFSYGDWRKPKQGMTCMEIMNLKTGRTVDVVTAVPVF